MAFWLARTWVPAVIGRTGPDLFAMAAFCVWIHLVDITHAFRTQAWQLVRAYCTKWYARLLFGDESVQWSLYLIDNARRL